MANAKEFLLWELERLRLWVTQNKTNCISVSSSKIILKMRHNFGKFVILSKSLLQHLPVGTEHPSHIISFRNFNTRLIITFSFYPLHRYMSSESVASSFLKSQIPQTLIFTSFQSVLLQDSRAGGIGETETGKIKQGHPVWAICSWISPSKGPGEQIKTSLRRGWRKGGGREKGKRTVLLPKGEVSSLGVGKIKLPEFSEDHNTENLRHHLYPDIRQKNLWNLQAGGYITPGTCSRHWLSWICRESPSAFQAGWNKMDLLVCFFNNGACFNCINNWAFHDAAMVSCVSSLIWVYLSQTLDNCWAAESLSIGIMLRRMAVFHIVLYITVKDVSGFPEICWW